jgi:hypothetical protein
MEQRKKESAGKEIDMSDILDGAQKKARDHARTPMQVNKVLHFRRIFNSVHIETTVGRIIACRLHHRETVDARQRRLRDLEYIVSG